MDILCVGMLRSCSTWQYEVVCHLIERGLGGRRLGYLEGDDYAGLPPASPEVWRVVKAHHRHEEFDRRLRDGSALAVYSYRDVRDVAISLAHKLSTDLDGVLASGKLDELLEDDRFWRSRSSLFVQRYEDIVARPVSCVRDLAGFLNLSPSTREIESIATEYSFESNKKRAAALERRLRAKGVDLTDPRNAIRHDPKTLLHWNHLRDGRIGAWRQDATREQREAMAALFGDWLAANGYEADDFAEVGRSQPPARHDGHDVVGPAAPRPIARALGPFRLVLGRWLSAD